jgi:hypothetical protein
VWRTEFDVWKLNSASQLSKSSGAIRDLFALVWSVVQVHLISIGGSFIVCSYCAHL